MEDLQQLDARLGQLLAAVGDARRRHLARRIAIALRKSQAERIAAQQNPDGSAFEPRKPQPQLRGKRGRIKRMFESIRTRRHLKATSNADGATIGFSGRAGRIARVHQEGLIDAVNRRGLKVRYPVRTLLGFSPADLRTIRDTAIDHLGS
ncbi:phage virion morphogenesis protein [Aromatoleum toluclasticum]|uniref:Phage virion morphogenesis protein n=1 Tax=Denitromonas iodatirespirans TaxID=2795389 RepID=A0A944D816_DENI1|nr:MULTISPECIES: phage virion morphogenesis protein [Rhodocyclales]MBT0961664.1 phage virion morphogenesis protein [Denitromonas iodatirespirans]MCC4118774.1 phage virion morphogenesis protein [Aromatoleum toluclasticum]